MLQVNSIQALPSAKMGTVEFTGLEMIKNMAEGQYFAQASASPETMPALVLKRSSRVIPGFLGTPAGMTTTLQPFNAFPISSIPVAAVTCHFDAIIVLV